MGIRNIRKDEDEILRKKSKHVDAVTDRIRNLVKDMAETMYEYEGVGLAAPQVGILKRIVVIDCGDGLLELINPVLISSEGACSEWEGCLSVPGYYGDTSRPQKVVVEAENLEGEKVVITTGEGQELLARALCHEIDHLDGILFTDKATEILSKEELEKMKDEEKNH